MQWSDARAGSQTSTFGLPTTPDEVRGKRKGTGAQALASAQHGEPLITRHAVGKGTVILTLVPGMMGRDERAHPALPYLMNGLTAQLGPVQVRLPDGSRPSGEIMYQVNKTKDGWLVMLMNNRGVDKTQSGIARVDRQAFTDVVLHTTLPLKSVKEFTQPHDLAMNKEGEVRVRVHPGDVQVVYFTTP